MIYYEAQAHVRCLDVRIYSVFINSFTLPVNQIERTMIALPPFLGEFLRPPCFVATSGNIFLQGKAAALFVWPHFASDLRDPALRLLLIHSPFSFGAVFSSCDRSSYVVFRRGYFFAI